MTRGGGLERVLRWYPAGWRERYGAELAALIEDAYPDGAVPWRCRVGLLRSATVERLRAAGLTGTATPHGKLAEAADPTGALVKLIG